MLIKVTLEAESITDLMNQAAELADSLDQEYQKGHKAGYAAADKDPVMAEEKPAKTTKKKATKKVAAKKTNGKARDDAETAPTEAEVVEAEAVPTVEELVPRLKEFAAKNGAKAVKDALTSLGAAKLGELDDAGRAKLAETLGL